MTTFITLVSTSSVFSLYILLYVIVKRHKFTDIVNLFILSTASTVIYCFASAFTLLSTNFEQIEFWTIIMYVGMPFTPPIGLLFVMKYLGIDINKKRYMTLFIIPVISLLMVATNPFHHLHYRVYELDPLLGAPYTHLEIGTWYMIHGVFTFGCMFVAFLLLLSHWKETSKVYRSQLIALICGQLVPMLTAFLYLIGVTPTGIDPVPMVLWITSVLYLWAISSSSLFTIMPIAKDAIFNSINDGVIVLDDSYRIIEFNIASKTMFQCLNRKMYGLSFQQVWFELLGKACPIELENPLAIQEIEIENAKHSKRIYQVRTTLLQHHKSGKGLLLIFTDITDLKRLQMKLEQLAYCDELTGINNRRAFFQQCEQDFMLSKKELSPFTVILIDVDFFKKVNDTYGHSVGDQLLVHVVNVINTQLKENTLFARYGGEEFVIALKGYTLEEGENLANQLCKCLELHPFRTSEETITVSVSCGVAESLNESEETLYQLLNNADKALYSAKGEGRNRVSVYAGVNEEVFS